MPGSRSLETSSGTLHEMGHDNLNNVVAFDSIASAYTMQQ